MCGSLLTEGDFHRPLRDMQLARYEPITPSMAHEPPDQQLFLLAALPPSKWQIGLALESLIKTFVCHLGQVFMLRDLPCRTTC